MNHTEKNNSINQSINQSIRLNYTPSISKNLISTTKLKPDVLVD